MISVPTGGFYKKSARRKDCGGIMVYKYKTKGTCSRCIDIELEGEIIQNVAFTDGCGGNLAGISKLVAGRNAREVIGLMKGTKCGSRPTSCPDQLARALEMALLHK